MTIMHVNRTQVTDTHTDNSFILLVHFTNDTISDIQGWGQVQLTKYSSTPSTPNIYQVQVLVKYSFFLK